MSNPFLLIERENSPLQYRYVVNLIRVVQGYLSTVHKQGHSLNNIGIVLSIYKDLGMFSEIMGFMS